MNTFSRVDPFDFGRLYGDEKYSLNNMFINQAYFPYKINKKDSYYEVWSDRLSYDTWNFCKSGLESNQSGDAWLHGLSTESLLTFGHRLSRKERWNEEVTGIIIVRFTDAGQYPCYRITLVSQKSDNQVYSGNNGPHVRYDEAKERRLFLQRRMKYGHNEWDDMMFEMQFGERI
jgi:hypothetical protein